jgi:hypothetical protein
VSDWLLRKSEDERRRLELVRDDVVQGTLLWEGMNHRRAVLSADGPSWHIGRRGLLKSGFDITDHGTGTAVGTFSVKGFKHATLALPPLEYGWRRTSKLKGWRALERGDDEVARFQVRDWGKERVRIEVADAVAADVPSLPLVLLTCCFVAIVQRDDANATAGAVGAAGA